MLELIVMKDIHISARIANTIAEYQDLMMIYKTSYRESHNRLLNSLKLNRSNKPSKQDIEYANLRRKTDDVIEEHRLENQLHDIWDK